MLSAQPGGYHKGSLLLLSCFQFAPITNRAVVNLMSFGGPATPILMGLHVGLELKSAGISGSVRFSIGQREGQCWCRAG